jgi:hypothetical protein
MSDKVGIEDAIVPVAIIKPVGGLDSIKVFDALRSSPWTEPFESPLLRLSTDLSVLPLETFEGEDGSFNDGKGSEASFWFSAAGAPVVAGEGLDMINSVDESNGLLAGSHRGTARTKAKGMFCAARVLKLPRINQEMDIIDVRKTRKLPTRNK